MKLSSLNKKQIETIYQERMKIDFPPSELKPLSMIYDAIEQGIYECLGLMDGTDIVGYAYLIRKEDDYLIDYLAVYPDRRNAGLGSEMIRLLREYLAEADSIIGEVENPEFAEEEADRKLQTRRYGFYMRNGFRDSGVRVTCFGVPFILIEMGKHTHTEDEMRKLYEQHYRSVLSAERFAKHVII